MALKVRFKAPKGGGTVELDDDATVNQLLSSIKTATDYSDVTVKYGWPPKALSPDQNEATVVSLSLHRENLTIVPVEAASAAPVATEEKPQAAQEPVIPAASLPGAQSSKGKGDRGVKDQNISVPMPETASTLVLRVMPDDNSCLFTAVGGALRGHRSPDEFYSAASLRQLVVDHIRGNTDKYSAAILGKRPDAYCANMLQPDTWGGEIELAILSEVFGIEICIVDVKTGTSYRIGENHGYDMRCVLVYSNIHYDRVAEIFVEGQEVLEFDVTRWPVDSSDHILAHTRELCKKLKDDYHYYTDTSDFVIRCNTCGWIGQGEKALVQHSSSTGHTDISEIKDTS
ncbi:hypothetical protein M426DRAFT_16555 [Hypoxylon sp. CI-4A]|nr:hypothetical protein M426DRAFT_16555 [Hypoxylon sp. CI-4A]